MHFTVRLSHFWAFTVFMLSALIFMVYVFSVVASLHIACVIQQRDLKQWIAELSVDMDKVITLIPVALRMAKTP